MPAWGNDGTLSVKLVNVSPGNTHKGAPAIAAIHILFEPDSGNPAMVLDGAELTARRTAMIAALGGCALASQSARVHLIVGAGAIATHLPGSFGALHRFERTLIWARRPQQATELSNHLLRLGYPVQPVSDLAEAAGGADVISCATMAREPVLRGKWLKKDAHINLIGAYLREMREADDDVLIGAEIWVDALPGALTDSGELSDPIARGVIDRSQISGDLATLLKVRQPLVERVRRTVFKSVGNARWDFLCTRHLVREVR